MNTNTNEPNELTPLITQPTAITRRSFIKRTGASILAASFAFGCLECEAAAANNCSTHVIELSPGFPYPGGIYNVPGTQFAPIKAYEWVSVGAKTAVIEAVFYPSPDTLVSTLFRRDNAWHLIHNEFGLTVQVLIYIKEGAGNPQLAYTSETVDIELETQEVQNGGDPAGHTITGTSDIQQSTEANGDYISQLQTFGTTWAFTLMVAVTTVPSRDGKSIVFQVSCTPSLQIPQTDPGEIGNGNLWMNPGTWQVPIHVPGVINNDDGSVIIPQADDVLSYPAAQYLSTSITFSLIRGDN